MTDKTSTWSEMLDLAESSLGTPKRTLEICKEALSLPPDSLPLALLCRAHYLTGFSLRLLGDLADAARELTLALKCAESGEAPNLVASVNMQLGVLYLEELKTDLAIETLTLAAQQFADQDRRIEEGFAIYTLYNAHWQNKNEAAAIKSLEKALLIFTRTDSVHGLAAVHCGLVHMAIDKGQYDLAIERANTALRVLPQKTHLKNRIFLKLTLADCYLKQEDADLALSVLANAIAIAKEEGYHLLEARGLMLQYHALNRLDRSAEAEECKLNAEHLAKAHGFELAMEGMLNP